MDAPPAGHSDLPPVRGKALFALQCILSPLVSRVAAPRVIPLQCHPCRQHDGQ
jgi:hypothetical protein